MSSIAGTSSPSRGYEALNIEHVDDKHYVMNGREANEAQVNQALAPRGLAATNGHYRTTDGFELRSTNVNAATHSGDAPLPNVSGSTASPSLMSQKMAW